MNWIRRRLMNWLFPEYSRVCLFMAEIDGAKLSVRCKSATFKEPVVLVGNLESCNIKITPTVNNEIVLSRIEYSSLLEISGNHQTVTQSIFEATKEKVVGLVQ